MSLFNPFAAIGGLITQRLGATPFGQLAGLGGSGPVGGMPTPGVQRPMVNMPSTPVVGQAGQVPSAMTSAVQTSAMDPALKAGKMDNMPLQRGILEAAQALGIDPLDLATTISYETGGTFDPVKKGPTTKWGTHRGLIQFGEPQAREFGVDWNNPVGSQLGPDGAIVKYLRKAGVKPGMGLKDIYSAINAGAPGLYDRSDAAAGGAPGTVADKVAGMGAHRQKAEALLTGKFTPGPASAPPSAMDRVFAAIGTPDVALQPGASASGEAAGSEAPTPLDRVMAAVTSKPTSRQMSAQQSSGDGQEQGPTSNLADVAARKAKLAEIAAVQIAQPTHAQARKQALRRQIGLGDRR